MEEKEFPKKGFFKKGLPDTDTGLKPKLSGISRSFFVFLKFAIGLCLLPFVYSATISFLEQFNLLDKNIQDYFWRGVISLVLIYLFIWEPGVIYIKGQKLTEIFFNFFKPLIKIAPYLLPIYTLILLAIYAALSWAFQGWVNYFVFLLGFTLSLHLIFSAKTLRSKKEDFFKTNYIFGFSLVYIINLALLSFFLSIIFYKFSFIKFSNEAYRVAHNILAAVFMQFFVNR